MECGVNLYASVLGHGSDCSRFDQTLVAPLTTIIESLKPRAGDVRPLGPSNFVLKIRDAFVPLIDTGAALGFGKSKFDPTEGVALLVESDVAGQVALMVDHIQGQRQVVIKSLGETFRNNPNLARILAETAEVPAASDHPVT